MTAPAEVEYRTWYQPRRDERGGHCYCRAVAVGGTTYFDGERSVERRHCDVHLPEQGGGQS